MFQMNTYFIKRYRCDWVGL